MDEVIGAVLNYDLNFITFYLWCEVSSGEREWGRRASQYSGWEKVW